MNRARPAGTPSTHPRWEDTTPMPRLEPLLAQTEARAAAAAPVETGQHKPEPPFKRVTKGLEIRELEGQTLFDQFFGPSAPQA